MLAFTFLLLFETVSCKIHLNEQTGSPYLDWNDLCKVILWKKTGFYTLFFTINETG